MGFWDFWDFLFTKPKTTAELVRENKRMLNRSMRDLDRESTRMEREEQKTIADMKRLANQGDTSAVRPMALSLIRSRQHRKKITTMRANIQAVAFKVETMKSQETMTEAMQNVTRAMVSMNKQMNLPLFKNLMSNFERQSELMNLKEEMVDEAIDGMMDEDDEPLGKEMAVDQILDELGIQLTEKGDNLPATKAFSPPKKVKQKQMDGISDAELQMRLENLRQT